MSKFVIYDAPYTFASRAALAGQAMPGLFFYAELRTLPVLFSARSREGVLLPVFSSSRSLRKFYEEMGFGYDKISTKSPEALLENLPFLVTNQKRIDVCLDAGIRAHVIVAYPIDRPEGGGEEEPPPPPPPDCDPFEVGDVQSMFSGSVTLNSDGDIAALAGFDGMTGNLTIGAGVTSLVGLEELRYVGGFVKLNSGNTSLTTLTGFDNLTTVEGDFDFSRGGALTTLAALAKLHRVGGSFDIESHEDLGSLNGALPCLDSADNVTFDSIGSASMTNAFLNLRECRYVNIQFCDSITSVAGSFPLWAPDAVTWGSTQVALFQCPQLASATGAFASVVQVQEVKIRNTALTTVDFLDALTTIAFGPPEVRANGNLTIRNNAHLLNLNGLSSLVEVGVAIDVEDNAVLSSISGLGNVNGGSFNGDTLLQSVVFANNPALPTSAVAAFISALQSQGYVGETFNEGNQP